MLREGSIKFALLWICCSVNGAGICAVIKWKTKLVPKTKVYLHPRSPSLENQWKCPLPLIHSRDTYRLKYKNNEDGEMCWLDKWYTPYITPVWTDLDILFNKKLISVWYLLLWSHYYWFYWLPRTHTHTHICIFIHTKGQLRVANRPTIPFSRFF